MKITSKISVALIVSLTTFACNNQITSTNIKIYDNVSVQKNSGTVSLSIDGFIKNKLNGFKTKAIDFNNTAITKLKLEIKGNGITTPVSQTIDWTPGTAATFNVSVLAGKNRILTLSGLNSIGNTLVSLMGAVDVNAGQTNPATISYFETVVAQVLLGIFNTKPALLDTLNLTSIRTYVTNITGFNATNNNFTKINPVLVDSNLIANSISNSNGILPSETLPGLQLTGNVNVVLNVTGAKIIVNDLSSAPVTSSTTTSTNIANVSTGNWQLTVIKDGYTPKTVDISVVGNSTVARTINLDNLFANYISVGDSLTSGYQSGTLQKNRQQLSYPSQIARSGGVDLANFKQPYLAEPGTGFGFGTVDTTTGIVSGEYKPDGTRTQLTTVNATNLSLLLQASDIPPFNNLGIPGATVDQIINTKLSSSNPYFSFILRNSGAATDRAELQQAIDGKPTLLTLWAGNNDVLGAATSGNSTTVTPVASFTTSYSSLVSQLLAGTSADIFVANIPDVTSIPYTSTIVTQGFADPGTNKIAKIQFPTGNPAAPLSALTSVATQEANVKYFLITALGELPKFFGGKIPEISGQYTLTEDEVTSLKATVDGYNSAIAAQVATNSRLTLVDMNKYLKDIKSGTVTGASGTSYLLDPNTSFSYDSVHPNSNGYSLVAQQFVKSINKRYGFNLPLTTGLTGTVG